MKFVLVNHEPPLRGDVQHMLAVAPIRLCPACADTAPIL